MITPSCDELTAEEHTVLSQLFGLEKRGQVRLPLDSESQAAKLGIDAQEWTELFYDLEHVGAVAIKNAFCLVLTRCSCDKPKTVARVFKPQIRPKSTKSLSPLDALVEHFRTVGQQIMFGKTVELINAAAFKKNASDLWVQGVSYETQTAMIDSYFDGVQSGLFRVATSQPVWKSYLANRNLLFARVGYTPVEEAPAHKKPVSANSKAREYLASKGIV